MQYVAEVSKSQDTYIVYVCVYIVVTPSSKFRTSSSLVRIQSGSVVIENLTFGVGPGTTVFEK